MPWKDGYTISDERGIADADIVWPGDARCCLTIVVDLSPPCGPAGIGPADLRTPEAQYGMHGALDALLGVLQRHRLLATFATPAVMADIHAPRIRALADSGHEVAAHGYRHEDVSGLDRVEEKARLDRTTAMIGDVVGRRPVGWFSLPRQGDKFAGGSISPNTMALLLEGDYAYMGNGLADDVPHWWVTDPAIPRAILALPYYYHFDDQFFLMFPAKGTGLEHADALLRNWHAEFVAQYRRGRQFCMTLHPHAIGFAHRLRMLDRFLGEICGFPLLWNATGQACAAHWSARYPAATHLRLAPRIWQDHPGSLS
ncbi:polysaccharide deacetylase family protein [Falsiroseomonas sp. E2-1-a4]|uniref:polysaccharide deacetylase family protein n=1 Tax=Falsiroseomonas sp. E2-1-a4 TaxID=3239299 RepID=UPI003F2D6762